MSKDVEEIISKLHKDNGQENAENVRRNEMPSIYVDNPNLVSFMRELKENSYFLADLTAVEYEEHLETIYHLLSLDDFSEIRIKVKALKNFPQVMSIVSVWNAVNV